MTSIRLKIEESWYASMDCKVQKSGPWVCFYGGHSTGYKLGNHPKNIEPCAHRARTVRAPCAHRATTPPKWALPIRVLHSRNLPMPPLDNHPIGHAIWVSLSPLPTTTLAIMINWVQRMGQNLRHGEKVLQTVWLGGVKSRHGW